MDLNDLTTFVRVVDARSFSAAALQLGLTKSAVSKQVSRLEQSLKTRLLNRSTRQLSLTELGQMVYAHGCRVVEEAAAIHAEVAGMQDEPRGLLRVSTSFAFGNLHLNALLPEFMARYGEVRVMLHLNDRYIDLVEDGFDLVVRLTDKLHQMNAVARPIAPLRFVLVASPAYLERHGTPASVEELARHRCLTSGAAAASDSWTFLVDRKEITVKVNSVLAINSSESLRVAMLKDVGIALLPTFAVGADIRAGNAVVVLPDAVPVSVFGTHLYAVYLRNRYLAPKVRVFIDYLLEKIGNPAYWDRP